MAGWLTSNYRIILLPTFETHDMVSKGLAGEIRSKTARMMLTFRHYEFKRRLRWKAWQRGALVLDVNEAKQPGRHAGTVGRREGDETGFGMARTRPGLTDSGLLTQVACAVR